MNRYVKPAYEVEAVEASDVVLASLSIIDLGEGTLGNITGNSANVSVDFSQLFGNR